MPGPSSPVDNRTFRLPTRHRPSDPQSPTNNLSPTSERPTKAKLRHGRVKSLDASTIGLANDEMPISFFDIPSQPQSPTATDSPTKRPHMAAGIVQDGRLGPGNKPKGAWATEADESALKQTASQKQLNEYRERLARDLERREMSARGLLSPDAKNRVSPIQEENGLPYSQPLATTVTTTSTESGNTIREGFTPAPMANTPSYPFPRMATGTYGLPNLSKSSGASRSSHPPFFEQRGAQDKVTSGDSTPASTLNFNPVGYSPRPDNADFPTPNLYELSLMLSAEPGLDAWWNTVVQIMKDVYMAERVTLSVPADTTDVENVPWGQKATYNEHEEDQLSLGYMARSNNTGPSDFDTIGSLPTNEDSLRPDASTRPGLQTRHSFSSYEENKARVQEQLASSNNCRPSHLTRSKSYLPQTPREVPDGSKLKQSALREHDLLEEQQSVPQWADPSTAGGAGQSRVMPVLQALDFEADPLIDHTGVTRVLERGKAVTLTRSYPYIEKATAPESTLVPQTPQPQAESSKRLAKHRSESSSRLSNMLGTSAGPRGSSRGKTTAGEKVVGLIPARLDEESPRPPTPKYEEYEQAPPSPWSQSPAPSPAIRTEAKENPFFINATVDEESFNPSSSPADYTSTRPPEAIGMENSWTVLHIPLKHILLSRQPQPFKLDNNILDQRSPAKVKEDEPEIRQQPIRQASASSIKKKEAPIAILSILSPIIPYPSSLRHSLEHLSPQMATSFSLCQHYSNLENELVGLRRRPVSNAGYGVVAADGRSVTSSALMTAGELSLQQSLPGSITSPSEYSGVSRSIAGSPAGTPGWEHGGLGSITEKRSAASPAAISHGGESYFNPKQRSTSVRQEALGASSRSNTGSQDGSPVERRSSRLSNSRLQQDIVDTNDLVDQLRAGLDESPSALKHVPREGQEITDAVIDRPPTDEPTESAEVTKNDSGRSQNKTLLHTRGADFASTFGSLPQNANLPSRPAASRQVSYLSNIGPTDMVSPTDKLTRLILDSLPVHVFVAAIPEEKSWDKNIVWVNSRFLSYRGQTPVELAADHWSSVHPEDRAAFLKAWKHSMHTQEQLSRTVRIRRFDGHYRWFHARAVGSKDKAGRIRQWLGSYMDIHDQHIAELKSARQQEIEASEAKHRLLANLIPQIIFTATEEDGITFANEQWLSYTGQSFEQSLGLGFMDFVHPEDLDKCRIPLSRASTPMGPKPQDPQRSASSASSVATSTSTSTLIAPHVPSPNAVLAPPGGLSRQNSSNNVSLAQLPSAQLTELAKSGAIKVDTDSNGRISYTMEVRLRSKTDEYRWHLIRCVEIDTIDFGSGASSYFGSATDINDLKLMEKKLKEAMESKGRFLSNMSHEIRTPLIGISGMVTFLQDTTLNEEQRDYTNTIQMSANNLIMIINDILDLSKVDAGMMKLKYEWFHTRSLIEDVNELVSTMAIAKGLELSYLVEADVPAWVNGDRFRIRQVLLNVIGNAIKFTVEGEVFSRCKVIQDASCSENEIMLQYVITDTGKGFTQKEAELIFKPFSQIDGSSTRQHGGSGLGLVISKQLVELHGGKMAGTAVPGQGSTFTFSARFGLPTATEHPDVPGSPAPAMLVPPRSDAQDPVPSNLRPLAPPKQTRGSDSPTIDPGLSSPVVTSNGSSTQSTRSARSHLTDGSSVTSVNTGLARFSEAAKASGHDLSQMKLEMPSGRSSPGRTATPSGHHSPDGFRPPLYSILIICPQRNSREATVQHIEMTLPKDVPHQITALGTAEEAQNLIGGDDPIKFTHIVINLGSAEAVVGMIDHITTSQKIDNMTILCLSDSVQRQAIAKLAVGTPHEELLSQNRITFIYKPVKPSRFAVIFDPDKVRDLSIDRNRSTAQQMVESQKASYLEIERRIGNKGYRVLVVEDNIVNQKVLVKYLKKIGVEVDTVDDGVDCIETVMAHSHDHYALIICDLHMPRKDGYQACREIRQWEQTSNLPKMPIIALSANVMSDVQEKCVAAGFSDYVTKPVDFIDLSRAMAKFF